jgi:hypothetical protein
MDITGHQVSYNVIARPRQWIGYRLPCAHPMAFRLFPLVKSLHTVAKADSQLRRLHRRLGEIRVPMCDVALAFFPLLICVLVTQRQYEGELPTVGKRPIWPVSSTIVWANIAPLPSTVMSCS